MHHFSIEYDIKFSNGYLDNLNNRVDIDDCLYFMVIEHLLQLSQPFDHSLHGVKIDKSGLIKINASLKTI